MHPKKVNHLREILIKRGIDHFIHCTPIENLRSILDNGILPRQTIEKSSRVHGHITDMHRFDEHTDASCFSVQNVNFDHLRRIQKSGEAAVIVVSNDVILNHKCAFYHRNASKNDFKYQSLSHWQWSDRFEELFTYDEKARIFKDGSSLPLNMPTYSDAEVQVFGDIPTEYIEQVAVKNDQLRETFKGAYSGIEFIEFLGEWK